MQDRYNCIREAQNYDSQNWGILELQGEIKKTVKRALRVWDSLIGLIVPYYLHSIIV